MYVFSPYKIFSVCFNPSTCGSIVGTLHKDSFVVEVVGQLRTRILM